ncbi:MAG: Ger(x)C family spore germination protein [Clostridia bacterium]|nr:Ger(x)C family spore germination protein [Clostridia bacterium]
MKNKFIKKLLIFFILITNITTLSGCYDSRGIEDLAYVTALGIDILDNDVLSLTFQISIPGTSSESGSSQSSKTENTTVQCSSIDAGISLVNSYISKQINLSHCKAIIFSEKIASKGLNKYIDTLSNNIEIRPNCNIIISRCSAKDFIENATPSIETLTARYYEVALKSSEYTGYTTATELATFVSDVKNSFVQASAILGGINTGEKDLTEKPYVGIDGNYKADQTPIDDINNIETFGTAVFHDDKLVGELSGLETICFLLVSDKIESCTISVPSPFETESEIDLLIKKSKNSKISVEIINGSPYISVDLFLEAHGLTLNETVDYTSIKDIKQIESSSEKYLKSLITNFLYKTSKEFNSDISGFGKYALSKYLTWQDWENSNWNENYKNAFFNVTINISIISGSEFDKSP